MKNSSHTGIIVELKAVLPESAWPWVIRALRQDSLVWGSLRENAFRNRALKEFGDNPKSWSPAHLALLALRAELKPKDLCAIPMETPPTDLRQRAAQAFEIHSGGTPAPLDFNQAGLLALALRERYRLTHSWKGLLQDLGRISNAATLWSTASACLYGMIPTPGEMLQSLTPALAIHTLLANPTPPDETLIILHDLASKAGEGEKLHLLGLLAIQRPELAETLARKLPASGESIASSPAGNDPTLILSNELNKVLHDAAFNQLAALPEQSITLLDQAWDNSQQLQFNLASRLILSALRNRDPEKAWLTWDKVNPTKADNTRKGTFTPSPGQVANLALDFLDHGYVREAGEIADSCELFNSNRGPAGFLLEAGLATKAGNRDLARQAARDALAAYKTHLNPVSTSIDSTPEELRLTDLKSLAKLFLELRLSREAAETVFLALNRHPNDPSLALLLTQSQRIAGEIEDAIHYAHLSVALEPDRLDLRRELATTLEMGEEWSQALAERTTLIERQSKPTPEDLLAYANCALHAGQPHFAQKTCQQILQRDPENGLAHAILGQVMVAMDDTSSAEDHFNQAIQLAPHLAVPWLALANTQASGRDPEKALETLQSASHAAPDHPEIHLALGEAYLESGSPTQALSALRKANELYQLSTDMADPMANRRSLTQSHHLQVKIGLLLGGTLHELGHPEEALNVMEPAYQSCPAYPGLAQAYAKTLLAQNRAKEAIPPLAAVLQHNPRELEPYLDYARAHLAIQENPREAVNTLERALRLEPDHAETMALMAEALAASGESSAAIAAYRRALASELKLDPDWYAKLSTGLGCVALDLEENDTAVAALQQAWQTKPDSIEIAKELTRAYQAAKLSEQALRTAQAALELAPAEVDHLSWFAEQAEKLEAHEPAIEALNRAIELTPQRVDLLLRLGELQHNQGDVKAALSAFTQAASLENATVNELRLAGKGLLALKNVSGATDCLERAIQMATKNDRSPDSSALLPALYIDLAAAHTQAGDHEAALESLDRAIKAHPKEPELRGRKADLLVELKRSQAALACLEQALTLSPEDAELHLRAALIHRKMGDLPETLTHAEQAIGAQQQKSPETQSLGALGLAADLSWNMLQPEMARRFIEQGSTASRDVGRVGTRDYFCLRAELALDVEEEIAAADALTYALQIDPGHPRALAIQARLALRGGNPENAAKIFKTALTEIKQLQPGDERCGAGISLSETALELHEWDSAIHLTNQSIADRPLEPLPHLGLARALVLRGEYQRLCQHLKIVRHAPGETALSNQAQEACTQAIRKTRELLSGIGTNIVPDPSIRIATWEARGQAVFNPSPEHIPALAELPPTPKNRSAHLAALLEINDLENAHKVALGYFQKTSNTSRMGSSLLAHIALALSQGAPERAKAAAQAALDLSARGKRIDIPLYHALKAHIYQLSSDRYEALDALDTALSIWGDEPNWHVLAAELQFDSQDQEIAPDLPEVINHLEQAIHLEPENTAHRMKLGEVYLKAGGPERAIPVLEEASRLEPDRADPWQALARAHHAAGTPEKASACAERAIILAPNQIQPRLLRAEIALQTGDPQLAQEHSQAAVELNPNNTKALLLLAKASEALDQPAHALDALEKAIPLLQNPLSHMLQRAELMRSVRGEEASIEALEDLANQQPEEPTVLLALAEAYTRNNQTDQAIQTAQKALGLDPEALTIEQRASTFLLLGRLLRRDGQLDQAIHHLSQAIECTPDDVDPYLELGRAYQDRRDDDEALMVFHQAVAVAPEDPRPYLQAGLTLKEAKDFDNAEYMLRRAADLAPDDLTIRRQLGILVAINLVHNHQEIAAAE
jgi:tetratricopeptide (TPR) repeat protein